MFNLDQSSFIKFYSFLKITDLRFHKKYSGSFFGIKLKFQKSSKARNIPIRKYAKGRNEIQLIILN